MAVTNKVRTFNFLYKLLMEDRKSLLSYPTANKPTFNDELVETPLPISTPTKEQLTNIQVKTFFETLKDIGGLKLHNVMILKNGKTIVDARYQPYEKKYWNTSHSLCKSIVGMAVGIAIKEGFFQVDDNVHELLVGKTSIFTNAGLKQLTVKHLLTMTSGVNFRETNIVATSNWSDSFLKADFSFLPGTAFQYNSMNTYMLAKIIYEKTGQTLMEFLTPRLFEPLGITNIAWEKGPEGFEKAGWGMYLTIEAMAKLGQLVLQLGSIQVNGQTLQLIPKSWMRDMLYPHEENTTHKEGYGYQIWVDKNQEYYCFSGLFGQTIYINPKYQLVAAFTSGNNNIFNSVAMIDAIEKYLCMRQTLAEEESDLSDSALVSYLQTLQFYPYHLLTQKELPEVSPVKLSFFDKVKGFFKGEKALDLPEVVQKKETLPESIMKLGSRKYGFKHNVIGLLPIIIQTMNGNFALGLEEITFEIQENILYLYWQEQDAAYELPIGLYQPLKTQITIHEENFIISSFAELATDEDEHFVLKLSICFLETSSVRYIKFFFFDEGNTIKLKFDESPSVAYLTNTVFSQLSSSELPSFLGKDNGYLKFMIDRLTIPEIIGNQVAE